MVIVFTDSSSSCSNGSVDSKRFSSSGDDYILPRTFTRGKTLARITCKNCNQRCIGKIVQTISTDQSNNSTFAASDVNRAKSNASFYHVSCFVCSVCSSSLSRSCGDETGYFEHSGRLFCPKHYQILFGEKCAVCDHYLSGQTLSVFGKQFHKNCLTCNCCGSQIEGNERISNLTSFTAGGSILCNKCSKSICNEDNFLSISLRCAGCNGDRLDNSNTVLAMGYSFHAWCFKCCSCRGVLDGLYFYDKFPSYSSPNYVTDVNTRLPSALCFDCYFAKCSTNCQSCKDIIGPSDKRLEIGYYDPDAETDTLYSYHPNCAKCYRCLLWFVDGEKVLLGKSKLPLKPESEAYFIHEDCSKSKSREFLKCCNITLRQDQQDNYANVRSFLRNSVNSRIGSSSAAIRRSWAAPATGTSPAEIYLPKTAQMYRSTYLDPKDLNSGGACINSSLYCRFRSSECPSKTKEEKMISYQGMKFHGERSVDMGALYTEKGVTIYPKEVLSTMNKALPKGVNRCKLESHLSESDFFLVFQMGREEFYKLPEWKRTFLKKMHNLF